MKVKATANLSTAQGWRAVGEEFTVNAVEAEALVTRGLVEPLGTDAAVGTELASQKPPKGAKGKA